ncbi:UNVERIFIED_CONTAM: hypothetical protein GTU68_057455 [Idotea baltica]|nr:hypothetical protein [Idotea baltica]
MGILNLTPDSFSDGGRFNEMDAALAHTESMLENGATILDIGGYSSRPGAEDISPEKEVERIGDIVANIHKQFPEAILSIDTFRAKVARAMLERGAHMINDISGGLFDQEMLATVAEFKVPYVLMHIQGTPQTMQVKPSYHDVALEVWDHLNVRIKAARDAGITDIVVDPGFGFGKTVAHNYDLFRNLDKFKLFGIPLLVGISRKSMVYRLMNTTPDDVGDLTTALHLKAMESGANILRVHDVKPAQRAVALHQYLVHGTL